MFKKSKKGKSMKKLAIICAILGTFCVNQTFALNLKGNVVQNENPYKNCTQDEVVIEALETLKTTSGEFSRKAILGDNLTSKPIKIEFKDLSTINPNYAAFDALGWKQRGKLYIYINKKHKDAPKEALAALLAHEALHQDELNSLNEETYAWTLEAAVWTQLSDENPQLSEISHPLVERENVIKKLFIKGNYTNNYIRKFVITNKGYQNLPERSPGFESVGTNKSIPIENL